MESTKEKLQKVASNIESITLNGEMQYRSETIKMSLEEFFKGIIDDHYEIQYRYHLESKVISLNLEGFRDNVYQPLLLDCDCLRLIYGDDEIQLFEDNDAGKNILWDFLKGVIAEYDMEYNKNCGYETTELHMLDSLFDCRMDEEDFTLEEARRFFKKAIARATLYKADLRSLQLCLKDRFSEQELYELHHEANDREMMVDMGVCIAKCRGAVVEGIN